MTVSDVVVPVDKAVVDKEPITEEPQEPQEPPPRGSLRFKRHSDIDYCLLFPQLARPPLLDGSHAGDLGFDPLGFADSQEKLYAYMESEVRHCRLAMLCAFGWPLSELKPVFPSLLAEGGRAPSVLNGHLFNSPSVLFVALVFGVFGYLDFTATRVPKKSTFYGYIHSLDYAEIEDEWPWGVAGDFDFDPLGFYGLVGKDAVGRKVLRDLEIAHGRVAMLGVLAYVLLEVTLKKPVVDLTPFLFNNYH